MGLRSALSPLFVNAGSAARRTGDWDWVIGEIETVDYGQLEPADRAAILVSVTMLRAARGEDVAGELAQHEADLATVPDVQSAALSRIARGFASSVVGRYAEARDRAFAAAKVGRTLTLWALPLAGRYAVLAGDPEGAHEAVRELGALGISGPALAADVETILAGCVALEGDTVEALAGYRRALSAWCDLGLVWDEALCAIDMATLLDPAEPEVGAAAEAARTIFTRLGARPFLEQLETAVQREPSRAFAVGATIS